MSLLPPYDSLLPPYDSYDPGRANLFFEDLRTRLKTDPSVQAIAYTESRGGMAGDLIVDGVPRKIASSSFTSVEPGYFAAVGLSVSSGRDFAERDSANAPLVGIVSDSFACFLVQDDGGTPIGRRITMPFRRPPAPPPVVVVVGVVPEVITSVTALEPKVLYMPSAQQAPTASRMLVIRASADADLVKRQVVGAIREIDRSVIPGPIQTIDERLAAQMGPQQFGAAVLGTLGAIAVLLTLLGIYVVAESMAVRRMRELAIRAALGGSHRRLFGMVVGDSARLIGLGVIAGLGLIWMGRIRSARCSSGYSLSIRRRSSPSWRRCCCYRLP